MVLDVFLFFLLVVVATLKRSRWLYKSLL